MTAKQTLHIHLVSDLYPILVPPCRALGHNTQQRALAFTPALALARLFGAEQKPARPLTPEWRAARASAAAR